MSETPLTEDIKPDSPESEQEIKSNQVKTEETLGETSDQATVRKQSEKQRLVSIRKQLSDKEPTPETHSQPPATAGESSDKQEEPKKHGLYFLQEDPIDQESFLDILTGPDTANKLIKKLDRLTKKFDVWVSNKVPFLRPPDKNNWMKDNHGNLWYQKPDQASWTLKKPAHKNGPPPEQPIAAKPKKEK